MLNSMGQKCISFFGDPHASRIAVPSNLSNVVSLLSKLGTDVRW